MIAARMYIGMLCHGAQALADANAANRKTLLALGMFSQGVLTCSFAAANAFVRAPMRTSQFKIMETHGNPFSISLQLHAQCAWMRVNKIDFEGSAVAAWNP